MDLQDYDSAFYEPTTSNQRVYANTQPGRPPLRERNIERNAHQPESKTGDMRGPRVNDERVERQPESESVETSSKRGADGCVIIAVALEVLIAILAIVCIVLVVQISDALVAKETSDQEAFNDLRDRIEKLGSQSQSSFASVSSSSGAAKAELLNKIKDLNVRLNSSLKEIQIAEEYCKGSHNDSILKPLFDEAVTLEEARRKCSNISGRLTEIHSYTVMMRVMRCLREKEFGRASSTIAFYTNLTARVMATGVEVFTSTDEEITIPKWYPGYPYTTTQSATYATHTALILSIYSNPVSGSQYYYHVKPDGKYYPLCELRVPPV